MRNLETTVEKVRKILSLQLDIDKEKIGEATNIAEDLGADSLDVVELMMSIEEDFGITIDEEDVRTFQSVGDVAAYIDNKL